jgi:hypothetical protein
MKPRKRTTDSPLAKAVLQVVDNVCPPLPAALWTAICRAPRLNAQLQLRSFRFTNADLDGVLRSADRRSPGFGSSTQLTLPRQASASTSYTVQSRNRDQFLRIAAVHHSGHMPIVVDAQHDYHLGFDAMQSWVPPVNQACFDGDAGRT